MLDGLFIASIIGTAVQVIKEAFAPTVPAENWANKELYHEDLMNDVPIEQRMKNLENGKYKLVEKYSEPHKDPKTGQIIIENSLLYNKDVEKYGAYQAHQWANKGRYNLSPEELKKEEERIKEKLNRLYRLL